jgi:ABC-type phosphate/phosphonate transport system substrate-binding protein
VSAAFISYLGPNTVPVARHLGERLSGELGLDLTARPAMTQAELDMAIDDGTGQLFWMCGLLTTELIDSGRLDAEIVAAPVFPGEDHAVYRTVVIRGPDVVGTNLDDLAGHSLAINGTGSWSGYHALRAHLADRGDLGRFFGSVIETGGHDASIDRVLAGDVDCAAIDSSVWDDRIARDARLRTATVVARTRDWPAPPFAVSRALDDGVRRRLVTSLTHAAPAGLVAIVPARDRDYDPIRRAMTATGSVAW